MNPACSQANLPVVGANETETTFYVSMQDPLNMKDHGVYLSAPEVKFTDWLGKLSPVVTQGGTGGLWLQLCFALIGIASLSR